MRVYIKAMLAAGAVVWCGYHSTVFSYTAGAAGRPAIQPAQQTGTAGRSTEKTTDTAAEKAKPKPEPTPVGVPFGDQVSAVIGPNGGTLKSGDDAVKLEVPPGALSKNTTFAIQTITNEAPGRRGDAFRITPEGATFAVPATITFRYSGEDVLGSSPALLRVGYQDAKGYWRVPKEVVVDEPTHTVSVLTTHLSDWSMLVGLQLLPHTASVMVGDTVALSLQVCDTDTVVDVEPLSLRALPCRDTDRDPEGDGAPGGPFGWFGALGNWSVNGIAGGNAGVGAVRPTDKVREHATYQAPARAPKPKPNPVAVSVEVEHFGKGLNTKLILVSNITVIDPRTNCEELRDAETLSGAMTFGYTFSGTSSQGNQYTVDQNATVRGTLMRTSGTNSSTYVWRGPVTAAVGLSDSFKKDDFKESVAGTGALVDGSFMTVTVRASDCVYTVAVNVTAKSINTTAVAGTTLTQPGNTVVGVAMTGMRPVKGGMKGSEALWVVRAPDNRETDGIYSPGGKGKTLKAEFTRGQLGTAKAYWIIGPAVPR